MMLIRSVFLLLGTMFISPLWAFPCYYTLAKGSCWTKYNVTVDIIDAKTSNILTTVTVPSGKSWVREKFECLINGQKLMYRAQFSPVIWDTDKGKVYYAKDYLSLPDKLDPADAAWTISVCYPSDFAEIPTPLNATDNCACDFSKIPQIQMRKL